jgi:protein-disulfide isomerase
MLNLKKVLAFSLVVLVAIFIFVVLFFSKNYTKHLSEEETLLNDNRQALDMNSWVPAKDLRPIDENDFVLGDKKARLDMVIYEDLSDFYSVQFNKTLSLIKEKFSDKLRIAFRPVVNKSFPGSEEAYLLARCAGEQNKFFEMRELLLSKVENETLSEADFFKYAVDLKLDEVKINSCLSSEKYLPEIEAYSKEAENFGVYGSPTIFVGSEIVSGARQFQDVVIGSGESLLGMETIINKNLEQNNLLSQD